MAESYSFWDIRVLPLVLRLSALALSASLGSEDEDEGAAVDEEDVVVLALVFR